MTTTTVVLGSIILGLVFLITAFFGLCILYMTIEISKIKTLDTRLLNMESYLKEISEQSDGPVSGGGIAMLGENGDPVILNDVLFKLMHSPQLLTADEKKMTSKLLEDFIDQLKSDTSSFDFNDDEDE
jgi:hypothetical protein